MLNKLKKSKSNNKGFTIIEVMIVLAIAGLILLIVFLAVPALQRSSRNTQRKSDIGRLGSAATTVIANLNGQTLTTTNFSATVLTTETGALAYYPASAISASVGPGTYTVSNANAEVFANAACPTSLALTATTVVTTAANHQVAIAYATEGGGGASEATCVNE